ncbi:hypothetical protein TNCV_1494871 [Trichonephila clavipes]|nr:hypothetical protein TNCV_1494871 [Trichonephila clavipes]
MFTKQLALHHTEVITVDDLGHRVEAAWASVPVYAIQSLFDSMSRHISAVNTSRVSLSLRLNPGEGMDVCKCTSPLGRGRTLNSHSAANCTRLVENEEG